MSEQEDLTALYEATFGNPPLLSYHNFVEWLHREFRANKIDLTYDDTYRPYKIPVRLFDSNLTGIPGDEWVKREGFKAFTIGLQDMGYFTGWPDYVTVSTWNTYIENTRDSMGEEAFDTYCQTRKAAELLVMEYNTLAWQRRKPRNFENEKLRADFEALQDKMRDLLGCTYHEEQQELLNFSRRNSTYFQQELLKEEEKYARSKAEEEEESERFKEGFLQAREKRLFNEGNHPVERQVRRDQFDREQERRKEELAEIEKRKERDIGQGLVGLKESQVFSYFFLDLIDIMERRKDFEIALAGTEPPLIRHPMYGYHELKNHPDPGPLEICEPFMFHLDYMLKRWRPEDNISVSAMSSLIMDNQIALAKLYESESIDSGLVATIGRVLSLDARNSNIDLDDFISSLKYSTYDSDNTEIQQGFDWLASHVMGLSGQEEPSSEGKIFYIQTVLRLLCALDITTKMITETAPKTELELLAELNTPIFPYITVDESTSAVAKLGFKEILFAVHGWWTQPITKYITHGPIPFYEPNIFNKMLFTAK